MAKQTKNIVERVLKDYPETRSSDKELFARVGQEYGLVLSSWQLGQLFDMPPIETLTRVRRKLQEEGHYPATEVVQRHRRFKSLQVQQAMPKTKSDKVDKLINDRPEQLSVLGGDAALVNKPNWPRP